MVPGPEASASPGSLLEMQTSGPTSDSLNQKLGLNHSAHHPYFLLGGREPLHPRGRASLLSSRRSQQARLPFSSDWRRPSSCRFPTSRPLWSISLHPCMWLFAFCFSLTSCVSYIHLCLPDSHIQASSGIYPSSSSIELCRYLHF